MTDLREKALTKVHEELRAIAKRYGISDSDIYDLNCAIVAVARPAIIEECALKCEWIADQVQERKENQAIELGALRCRDIVLKLAKKP